MQTKGTRKSLSNRREINNLKICNTTIWIDSNARWWTARKQTVTKMVININIMITLLCFIVWWRIVKERVRKKMKKTDTMMISYNKKYNFSDDIYKVIKNTKKY